MRYNRWLCHDFLSGFWGEGRGVEGGESQILNVLNVKDIFLNWLYHYVSLAGFFFEEGKGGGGGGYEVLNIVHREMKTYFHDSMKA